jgi:hypothetical protein
MSLGAKGTDQASYLLLDLLHSSRAQLIYDKYNIVFNLVPR